MNTPDFYERREDRTLPEQSPTLPEPQDEVSTLARHRDPSLQSPGSTGQPDRARRTVSWVRPSELPTVIGTSWLSRGIDLQSELVRRSRRAPAKAATQANRRITRTAIARPGPIAPTEGLHL